MKSNAYLIFDFDGTLVDSFQAVMEKFNQLADEFKFRKASSDEVNGLRDLTSEELVKNLRIPLYKIPRVILQLRKLMCDEMQRLLPIHNMPEVLQQLHDMKIPMGILTSNSPENVRKWLTHHRMLSFFNFIHSESSYFGKNHVLKKIIRAYKPIQSRIFYIGDETRDIDAAKKCDLLSLAVTWGFNSEKILLRHQPHYTAGSPEDILKYVSEGGNHE